MDEATTKESDEEYKRQRDDKAEAAARADQDHCVHCGKLFSVSKAYAGKYGICDDCFDVE